MPVVPFIPAIISAGAAIGGAAISKSASDNATEAKSDAADKAVALTKEMYEQDRADNTPYRNLGAFSVGELGHLTGMPKDFGTQAVAGATAPRTAIPRDGGTTAAQQPLTQWPANQPTRDQMFRVPPTPEFQSLRDLGSRQQSSSSFVRMRSPDGKEEEDVDPREVGLFESHGAVRV